MSNLPPYYMLCVKGVSAGDQGCEKARGEGRGTGSRPLRMNASDKITQNKLLAYDIDRGPR